MNDSLEKRPGQEHPVSVYGANLPSVETRESLPEFEDSADLRDYLEIILRRKWLILTFLFAVFMTVLVVSLSMKPVFRASGRLEMSPRFPKVTKFEDITGGQMFFTRDFVQTQVKLLQSGALAQRVLRKMNLLETDPARSREAKAEGLIERFRKSLSESLQFGKAVEKTPDPSIASLKKEKGMQSWVGGNLEVHPERDTTLVNVSFSSTDPAQARDFVNTLIQEFISWQMDKRMDAASSAKQQLEKQLEVVRIQLERAESNLNAFAQKSGIVSLSSNLNLIYHQLEEVNKALTVSQTERIGKESVYLQSLKSGVSALPIVVESQMLQKLRADYVALAGQYQEMYTIFKDDYPKLKTLKARMVDIEKQIKEEENRMQHSLKNDYLASLKKEEALQKEAEEKKNLAMELNDRATQFKILEREVETSKLIHQSLLERSKEIDANVGTELGNIQVVEYASLPLSPYKPDVRRNLLLAIVIGLIGGIGISFFLEYLDNTVKRVDEITDRFHIPVLGVLPLVENEDLHDLDSLVKTRPKSSFAESIRTAKVSIQLSSPVDQPPRTFLITSTSAAEGKSAISSNLALAFAGSDEKVLLIDADLRKPRLHKVFSNGRGSKQKGLSQLLSGICNVGETIQTTGTPNLFFIPSGPIPPNPAELLASNRMRDILKTLGESFDRVILDAPPAVGFADVLVLGNYVNGVILVSILGHTHREALRMFRRSLYNVRGNLLGCLVNKLNVGHHLGGYYYKYYKYYHYYYQQAYGSPPESLPEHPPQERA
ncbi:GumC family protein [Syntrophobacter fumaroxidans]|uniref:non-specific protein-tyrosine kinase n=1 Tax=Syntrophobacter fumaroxidans (strain DSM 10017 / MPOB) TaxID=335543 RepID=A0LNJ2_SYNFM|nr:polysaccharide biosynthesis tyrosine autokinase [Syntrophobacter fumaroxidans]ABK18994.1 lipopolysaccharide biosynthesis [Syntrophobacter fumaroxidans MPOB]